MRCGTLRAVLSAVCVAGSVAVAGLPATQGGTFNLLSRENNGWKFAVHAVPRASSKVQIGSGEYVQFEGEPQERNATPGSPYLPLEPLSLGVPFGVDITAEIQNPVYEDLPGVLIAPTPTYRMTEDREAVAEYALDARAYAADTFTPATTLVVDPPFFLRQQRICTIHIAPYQYNPARKVLRTLVSGTLSVRYSAGPAAKAAIGIAVESDPLFEQIYKSLLVNYDEARQYRMNTRGIAQPPVDSTGSWFSTGRHYVRIPVAADGWQVLTRQALQNAGLNMSAYGASDVRLLLKGENVPFLWRPDTSLEFYGRKRTGDSTAFDFYSDTSMYWLTFGGSGSALSIEPSSQPSGDPSTSVTTARATRHFEENTDYYEGTGEAEITLNGPVAGEGWVWSYFYPGTTTSFPFSVDHVSGAASDSVRISVRLFSTTLHYNTPDHIARFWLNDSLVGQTQFTGRNGSLFRASVPGTWLKEGANSLKITSVSTPSVPNQFYLDWFEVEYTRGLSAASGSLVFSGTAGTGVASYTVGGLADSLINVIELGSRRNITGGVVGGNSSSGYSIVFKDSLGSGHQYVVVADAGRVAPAGIRGKEFSNLRNRSGGADYVIVTHRLFRTSAELLAGHRASFNGIRTLVVDVDELYDEFGYGFKSSEAIKTFLSYAYSHWPAPALSNVLFFGDASWDSQKFMSTTVKTDYVPAYGVPAGDNWYGCFNSTNPSISSLIMGRLPVEDTVQAARTVDKVIGYDSPAPGDWQKNFMFITGGVGVTEQSTFNSYAEPMISNFVVSAPIGGTPFRVYKNTDDVINGDKKVEMRTLFKQGLVFTNFLGHAAGRIWNVDIGDPNELENTDGKLPFIASTSCNVSAFAEPSSNVLSEDFVLGDHRGAIAMWGASSLGYAASGSRLVTNFLTLVAKDTVRVFGAATTGALYKLWQEQGSGYVTLAMINLTPLLGDPLCRFPILTQPDIAIAQNDLTLNTETPTPLDSSLTLRVVVHQYGLLPADSVAVRLTDEYGGSTHTVIDGYRFRASGPRDTLSLSWPATTQAGQHQLTLTIDPNGAISEASKANNTVIKSQYVYADLLLPVWPLEGMAVPPGAQRLRVTSALGLESSAFNYVFELDTLSTFASAYKVTSGGIAPGVVSGEWMTPSLPEGPVYYWRAQTVASGVLGNWVTGSFRTVAGATTAGTITLSENSPGQFNRGMLTNLTASDSGLTLVRNEPTQIFARSLGPRHRWLEDYYSIFRVNEKVVRGFWWVIGYGFLVLRLNEFTGEIAVRGFDTPNQAAQADSMRLYLRNTPVGNYVGIIVVMDGRTNVSDSLYAAIESLGSTQIRSVLSGQSWSLIARKGYPGETVESLTNDSAVVSRSVPNTYAVGSGRYRSVQLPVPVHLDSLRWGSITVPSTTYAKMHLLGRTSSGLLDTLRTIPPETTHVSLAGLDGKLADTSYVGFALGASLSTSDPSRTPFLQSVSLTMAPPPDLAISQQTIGSPESGGGVGDMGLPVTIYNIGYRDADSARVSVSVVNAGSGPDQVLASGTVGRLPMDSSRNVVLEFSTAGLNGQKTLEIRVAPPSGARDMIAENNSAHITLNFTSVKEPLEATLQLFADGIQLMDGDYVASRPKLSARLANLSGVTSGTARLAVFVDNALLSPTYKNSGGVASSISGVLEDGADFVPQLPDGTHQLTLRLYRWNGPAGTDSIERQITVNVQSDVRILRVFNYPNPFQRETEFTFVLTGADSPDEVHIRIFTVAGRKIREITVPRSLLQVGFNRVQWDGRDDAGDTIANGYYFYQIQVRGSGTETTAIEKMVKMR
jgi:hypothetical protein